MSKSKKTLRIETPVVEKLVDVRRVTKVVTGGRNFAFSSCVIVGDKAGLVGYDHGKAKEVVTSKLKAVQAAKKNVIRVPLYKKRTIHHDVVGRSGASLVILRKAKPGTGIIAGGPMRAVFDALGIHDIVAKSLGSSNVHSMLAATFNALSKLSSLKMIADRRGKKVSEISSNVSQKPAKILSDHIDQDLV